MGANLPQKCTEYMIYRKADFEYGFQLAYSMHCMALLCIKLHCSLIPIPSFAVLHTEKFAATKLGYESSCTM